MTTSFDTHAQALRARYDAFVAGQPKARIRTLAAQMRVSEAELVAAGCGGIRATALKGPVQDIFKSLGSLGRVMALTRNNWCVHERHGRYEDIRAGKTMGLVLGPDIDLRAFFGPWRYAWAVTDNGRRSLQFFDAAGMAVHKVFVTDETDALAYDALVDAFIEPDPRWPAIQPAQPFQALATPATPALRTDWLAMQDTHEFHGLLQKHKVSRLTALRAAGQDLAQQVPPSITERMLADVVAQQVSFMCFVGNHGMIQIHTGPIHKLLRTGPWFNVLDPHFNLHLDTTAIHTAWVVNKPTSDGWVTSLECYTENGELIVQFFGARKPGQPELANWRALLCSYCAQPLAA